MTTALALDPTATGIDPAMAPYDPRRLVLV